MDGDLQNDPADIPLMLAKLDEGYDAVLGQRANRQDKLLLRKLPSLGGELADPQGAGRAVQGLRLHAAGDAPRGRRRHGALRRDAPVHHRAHHATGCAA